MLGVVQTARSLLIGRLRAVFQTAVDTGSAGVGAYPEGQLAGNPREKRRGIYDAVAGVVDAVALLGRRSDLPLAEAPNAPATRLGSPFALSNACHLLGAECEAGPGGALITWTEIGIGQVRVAAVHVSRREARLFLSLD